MALGHVRAAVPVVDDLDADLARTVRHGDPAVRRAALNLPAPKGKPAEDVPQPLRHFLRCGYPVYD
jgi:hypothetical protein